MNQFAGGAPEILTITPTSSAISVPITLAWADPPGQNVSNFDLFWTNTTDPTKSGCLSAAGGADNVITQTIALYPGNNVVTIATPDAAPAGKLVKLWVGGDGLTALSMSTPGGLVSPQAFTPGVLTVGAVNGSDGVGNNIEAFSAVGPITVAFPSQAKIQAPVLVAPDGINVDAAGTYFASTLFPDGNFYGTSASAPNAAAVAALLRGAFPNLTVAQLVSALESGATQLGASVPDGTFGYGRIDAMGALGTLPVPTITALSDCLDRRQLNNNIRGSALHRQRHRSTTLFGGEYQQYFGPRVSGRRREPGSYGLSFRLWYGDTDLLTDGHRRAVPGRNRNRHCVSSRRRR